MDEGDVVSLLVQNHSRFLLKVCCVVVFFMFVNCDVRKLDNVDGSYTEQNDPVRFNVVAHTRRAFDHRTIHSSASCIFPSLATPLHYHCPDGISKLIVHAASIGR